MSFSPSFENDVQLEPQHRICALADQHKHVCSCSAPTKRKSRERSIEGVALILMMIGAAAAAWVHLRHASIWYDEAVTLLTTSGHAKIDWSLGLQQFKPTADLGKILTDLYQRDVHPPLYFWVLALWRVAFGASLEAARALSLCFNVATLVLLYIYARAVRTRLAFVPVAIYAISSASLRYAYDARPYAMACFLVVLTLFLAQRRSRWTGVCAGACAATHYFAVLCVAPLLVLECIEQWKTNRRWAALTASSFAACCAPLLILVRAHIGARPQQYPGFSSLYEETCALFKGALAGAMPKAWLPGWALVTFLGACFAAVGCWWLYKKVHSPLPIAYALYLCGFLLLAIATNKSLVKLPTDYYLGIGAPWLALLIGFGINVFPRAIPVFALLLVSGTLAAAPMAPTIDYRKMAQEMRSECKDCPIVAGIGYSGAIPACVLYEAKGMKVLLLHPGDTVDRVVGRTGKWETVFLVPANEPATTQIEHELVEEFPSTQKDGYFEIDLAAQRKLQMGPAIRTAQIIGADRYHKQSHLNVTPRNRRAEPAARAGGIRRHPNRTGQ
jgi:hypothetical protein